MINTTIVITSGNCTDEKYNKFPLLRKLEEEVTIFNKILPFLSALFNIYSLNNCEHMKGERCSNFNEVMGDSERAVRKMESSFRMRNVCFSVFSTCILLRFLRNAILMDRREISDYL